MRRVNWNDRLHTSDLLGVVRSRNVIIHFGALLVVCLAYAVGLDPATFLIFSGCLATPVYIFLGWSEARFRGLVFTPLSFYFFWYSVTMGPSAIHHGLKLLNGEPIRFSVAVIGPSDLAYGYVIFFVGACFLHLGMRLARPEAKSHVARAGVRDMNLVIPMLLITILYLLVRPYLGFLGSILDSLNFALIAILCFVALQSEKALKVSKIAKYVLVGVGTIVVFFVQAPSTSKAYMMYSFLPLVWMVLDRGVSLKKLIMIFLPACLMLICLIMPLSEDLRQSARSFNDIDVWASVSRVVENRAASIEVDAAMEHFLDRQFDPVSVAYIESQVRTFGFSEHSILNGILVGLVPRVIWPDKPIVSRGAWFTYYLGFVDDPKYATTSTGMTAVGELYWSYGYVGVALGMFVLGIFVSSLWKMIPFDPRLSVVAMLLYVNLLFSMPNMAEASSTLLGYILLYLVFRPVFWLYRRRRANPADMPTGRSGSTLANPVLTR